MSAEIAEFCAVRPPGDALDAPDPEHGGEPVGVPNLDKRNADAVVFRYREAPPAQPRSKQDRDDRPLHRALEHCSRNRDAYLWAREYPDQHTGQRYYIGQDVQSFFRLYSQMDASERDYGEPLPR